MGANSLTYVGIDELEVRPVEVVAGRLRPFAANVYRRWYAEGKRANFLVVHRSDESVYDAAASATFGAPQRTIRLGDYVVWVWSGNLMPLLVRTVDRELSPAAIAPTITTPLNAITA
jgi:hypothetical protein